MARNQLIFEEAMRRANNLAWDARWQEAAREYERALGEFPEDLMAHLNLGMAFLELNRPDDALAHYRQAVKIGPDDPLPLQKVAQIQEHLGQRAEAAGTYVDLAKLFESHNAAGQALSAWQKVAFLDPGHVEAHIRLAEGHLKRGRPGEAGNEYLAAAIACRDNGDIKEALVYCDRALVLDRYNEDARTLRERLSLGQSLEQVKQGIAGVDTEQSPLAVATQLALSRLADVVLSLQVQEPVSKDLADFDRVAASSSEAIAASRRQEIGTTIGHAIDFQTRGVLDKAIEAYRSALDMGAEYPEIEFCLGVLHYKAMSYEDAIGFLRETVDLPDYALASHFALGQCYRAEGQLEDALQSYLQLLHLLSFQKGLTDTEGILQLYGSLVGTQGTVKDHDRAVAFIDSITSFLSGKGWEQRLQQANEHIKSLASGDIAISLADIVEVPGSQRVLEGLRRSQEYLQRGLPMAAIEECYWILDIADTYLPIHAHLAEVFVKQNKYDQAVDKYLAVANTYEIRGDARQAIHTYRRILDLTPMDTAIRPKLISLLTSRGQIDEAIEEYVELAEAYYHRIQLDRALEEYQEALALAPRGSTDRLWPVVLRRRIGQLYSQRLDWNQASAAYDEIKQLGSLDEEEQQELVELYYRAGKTGRAEAELDDLLARFCAESKYEEALSFLQSLSETRANEDGFRKRKATLLLKSGQKDQAVAELDALGESQLEQGNLEEAIATVKHIVSMSPDQVEGYVKLLHSLEKERDNPDRRQKGV